MKLRNGFVSNSSTTSWTCEVCGEQVSGMDLELEYADMFECENGHVVCNDHELKTEGYSIDYKKQELIDDWSFKHYNERRYYKLKAGEATDQEINDWFDNYIDSSYEKPEDCCPICKFEVLAEGDFAKFLEKETDATREEALADIQKANGRRKKLYDNEYIVFACAKTGKTVGQVSNEIRDKFENYEKFSQYINERG